MVRALAASQQAQALREGVCAGRLWRCMSSAAPEGHRQAAGERGESFQRDHLFAGQTSPRAALSGLAGAVVRMALESVLNLCSRAQGAITYEAPTSAQGAKRGRRRLRSHPRAPQALLASWGRVRSARWLLRLLASTACCSWPCLWRAQPGARSRKTHKTAGARLTWRRAGAARRWRSSSVPVERSRAEPV